MNITHLTTNQLRILMDECRAEYTKRLHIAADKGTFPEPELIMSANGVSVFKSIRGYHDANPHLDMLVCSIIVKYAIDKRINS